MKMFSEQKIMHGDHTMYDKGVWGTFVDKYVRSRYFQSI